jgi:NAD(P)-dependent dehydrogenase (short-subunit alcohol dehydrogenase family)
MLQLPSASRSYRKKFTVNYRSLFPDDTRSYRVDILDAAMDKSSVIWVNGAKYEFSHQSLSSAASLRDGWALLSSTMRALDESSRGRSRPGQGDICKALMDLDEAWASFESCYIHELMGVEERARGMVTTAVHSEQRLQELEHSVPGSRFVVLGKKQRDSNYSSEQGHFVDSVSKLNSVANVRRKGRDDLKADILVAALSALQEQGCTRRGSTGGAAVVLATDVVESYECVRQYLRKVGGCLERVDPHLSNNPDLVERLVDWEESWEVASRYVQKPALLGAICDIVEELRLLQRIAPEFKSMCDDCDVELFLVLPRIVWLWFLCNPDTRAELLRSLLPHRFGGENGVGDTWDAEISGLLDKFRQVHKLLMESSRSCDAVSHAQELLARRVVKGSSSAADFDGIAGERVSGAQAAIEGLMRDMEKYSMELQRHCADDWNQTSAILLQCLEGSMGKTRDLEDDCQIASL